MVFTAGDAPGNWRSFRLHEGNMLEAGDGGGHAQLEVQVLLEVRDECSFGDLAGGLGYGPCFENG
jgi:hypothetical protein